MVSLLDEEVSLLVREGVSLLVGEAAMTVVMLVREGVSLLVGLVHERVSLLSGAIRDRRNQVSSSTSRLPHNGLGHAGCDDGGLRWGGRVFRRCHDGSTRRSLWIGTVSHGGLLRPGRDLLKKMRVSLPAINRCLILKI